MPVDETGNNASLNSDAPVATREQYERAIKAAIKTRAGGIPIIYPKKAPTFEKVAPPFYEQKLLARVQEHNSWVTAEVKYEKGDADDLANWQTISVFIKR